MITHSSYVRVTSIYYLSLTVDKVDKLKTQLNIILTNFLYSNIVRQVI